MTIPQTRNAIVTGASRGIGAAIARRLAADGFAVTVNYTSNASAAEQVVGQIIDAGGQAIAVRADVADAGQVTRLFDQAEQTFGPLMVLVNSAGVMTMKAIADSSDDDFDRMVTVNLKGTFNTLREAAKRMEPGGRIITLSSSLVGLKMPTYGLYTATKAGVESLTAILSKELRGRNITVNAIAPGPTATDLFMDGKTEVQIAALSKMNPLERLGTPNDIAAAVAFLAGPDGGWINGQTVRANGGMI